MRYHGNESATPKRVHRYLATNYTMADGSPLTDETVKELLDQHQAVLDHGVQLASYASNVGDKIVEVEHRVTVRFDWIPDDNDD